MSYRPLTEGHIGRLSRGEIYSEAGEWRPDAYTLPFPDRLAEFYESYFDVLPVELVSRKTALAAAINKGAADHHVKISRSTLNEWLSGGRDPSVSSSDEQTRENIYRLCAAFDLDMELTEELFEKVFFTRAFDLKAMKEFAFFFFARKDYKDGIEGCRWYQTGEKVWEDVSGMTRADTSDAEQPVRNTVLLADRTEAMNEAEFLRFLSSHPQTFAKENRFARARERIREYAGKAWQMTPELASESGQRIGRGRSREADIPYEPLINNILGYAQRSTVGATGMISSLKSLPPQLTANFPTGQILRKICIGDVCSYDQIYKMFSLLLFYCYHVKLPVSKNREQRFKDFLRFVNLSLEREGCTELYPRQPYGGLLLFCAAQEDPIAALQEFIETAVAEESETVLVERMKHVPGVRQDTCLALIRCLDRDPFLTELTAGTLSRETCTVKAETLIHAKYYDDRPGEIIQMLYSGAGFSSEEKRVLECGALLPADGISGELFHLLFSGHDRETARKLVANGWLNCDKNRWSMNFRVRRVLSGQSVSGTAAREFLDSASSIPLEGLAPKDTTQMKKILKQRQYYTDFT